MDLRDLRGRAHRLLISTALASAAGYGAMCLANRLHVGSPSTSNGWFVLCTGLFAWFLVLISTLALLNHLARRKWVSSEFPRATLRRDRCAR